jgi:hypothetical protein
VDLDGVSCWFRSSLPKLSIFYIPHNHPSSPVSSRLQ